MAEKLPVRVRMAPSPTGPVHIGSIRTALFNYLFAKRNNGTFVVRIEDTDTERSKPEFEVDILEGFRWLGLLWDEGPEVGGPYEPYRQSERIGSYTKYLKQLFDSGDLYKCFCTEEDLEREHNEHNGNVTQKLTTGHNTRHGTTAPRHGPWRSNFTCLRRRLWTKGLTCGTRRTLCLTCSGRSGARREWSKSP